ncbi:hypothetical protein [uncultured Pseudodesulfovibrio sp.]|uniref:hypothetical protein n=1 Tax=uncultured Pseudodesulfovibrio sp. TaxID=2035858 RepID=UPI0029C635FF|nr:hypothetical protein [uncultured Pseudodesulfovibrio sp.]
MKLTANIESLGIPELFGNATKRILLHAAVYGPFAQSRPHKSGLTKALARKSFERLNIIALTAGHPQSYRNHFLEILRTGASKETQMDTVHASDAFLEKLKATYPAKVFIHPQTTAPCQPIIIVDNTIIFGQYAHCTTYAAHGFWGIIHTDVDKLLRWSEGNIPAEATDEEIAAYRLVCECRHAMQYGDSSCIN